MQEKRDNVQIAFTVLCGTSGLVISAAFPFLAYITLSFCAFNIYISLKKWSQAADNPLPENITFDASTKMVLTAFALLMGIAFVQLAPFAQMVLCTAAGAGIGSYFINLCILKSQDILNVALQKAASEADIDSLTRLLQRGADPFAPDESGDNAFHLILKNPEKAPLVLERLTEHVKVFCLPEHKPTINHIFETTKDFVSENNLKLWGTCWQRTKALYPNFSEEQRTVFYIACETLLNSYFVSLTICVSALTRYLRAEIVYPVNLNQKNKRNKTASELLNNLEITEEQKNKIFVPLQALAKSCRPVLTAQDPLKSQENKAAINHFQNK